MASNFNAIGPVRDQAAYTDRYPYYAEMCGLSGVAKHPGLGPDIDGGPGGHSVLYLNGVCRVPDAHYPMLALCDTLPGHTADGVGISANSHFSNANFVATEGRDFFFHGTLQPGEALTRSTYRETQLAAERQGILDGVIFHDWVYDLAPSRTLSAAARQDFRYDMSVATDYAVAFGRGRYCARLPLTRGQMADAVAFLNAENARYRDNRHPYHWNVLENNCSHLTHNALAATGLWDEDPIHQFPVAAAFDFPVPDNEFVDSLRRANDTDMTDLAALFRDPASRAEVLRDGVLPAHPGALAESAPVWPDNRLYATNATLIFKEWPLLGRYQPQFDAILRQPRYHDLHANAVYFAALYARLQAARRPLGWWLRTQPGLADAPEFPAFYQRFYQILAAERSRLEGWIKPPAPAAADTPHDRPASSHNTHS